MSLSVRLRCNAASHHRRGQEQREADRNDDVGQGGIDRSPQSSLRRPCVRIGRGVVVQRARRLRRCGFVALGVPDQRGDLQLLNPGQQQPR